jgi:hypothetical protein
MFATAVAVAACGGEDGEFGSGGSRESFCVHANDLHQLRLDWDLALDEESWKLNATTTTQPGYKSSLSGAFEDYYQSEREWEAYERASEEYEAAENTTVRYMRYAAPSKVQDAMEFLDLVDRQAVSLGSESNVGAILTLSEQERYEDSYSLAVRYIRDACDLYLYL